jgi:hypothetical protein
MGNTKIFLIACRIVKGWFEGTKQLKGAGTACACGCVLQLLFSCTALPPRTQSATPPEAASGAQQVEAPRNDPAVSGFFNGTPEGEKEAWLLFTKSGRYRIAQPEDFRFPEAAKKIQATDLDKASKHAYVGGDINRDGAYNDFAAIVVDTWRTDPNRFSLVIFSQPTVPNGRYTTQLLFSERDLSKTLLEWWSGGLAVREYHDDGTYDYCVVKSDKAFQAYSCDKEIHR